MKSDTPQDPRSKNTWFDSSTPANYLAGYREELNRALGQVDGNALSKACKTVETAAQAGKHVYVIGNGGSASIADHLCCDWTKGTHTSDSAPIKTHSLSSNNAMVLAVANDFGFENSFSKQIEMYLEKGDLLIAISSGGSSENIMRAVRLAKERGATVIGLSGFSGGKLREEADISLYIAANNYGIVEDAHQSLMHVIAQFITCKRENR